MLFRLGSKFSQLDLLGGALVLPILTDYIWHWMILEKVFLCLCPEWWNYCYYIVAKVNNLFM